MNFRIKNLDGIRAYSVIIVVINHLILNNKITLNIDNHFIESFVMFILDGQFGVSIFFVLSGFLINTLLIREERKKKYINVKNFYYRRALRIIPPFLLLLLFYLILDIFSYVEISHDSWLTMITYTKWLNWKLDQITAHTWSLGIEQFFYLFWPIIFILFKKNRIKITISLIVIPTIFRIYNFIYPESCILLNELSLFIRVDSILIGCLLALKFERINEVIINNKKTMFFLLIALVIIVTWIPLLQCNLKIINQLSKFLGAVIFSHSGFAVNLIILIFITLTIDSKNKLFILDNIFVNYIAKISYGLYLWQQFFTCSSNSWYSNLWISIFFIILIPTISYFLLEKNVLKLKNKFDSD